MKRKFSLTNRLILRLPVISKLPPSSSSQSLSPLILYCFQLSRHYIILQLLQFLALSTRLYESQTLTFLLVVTCFSFFDLLLIHIINNSYNIEWREFRFASNGSMETEKTLAMVKPDGLHGNYTDIIKLAILKSGFRILKERIMELHEDRASRFCAEHLSRSFLSSLISRLSYRGLKLK
ncbi:putative nucleoside diphosphate kinase 5, partial [Cucurbita argyrosperma subsp. argyrosperma]